MARNSFKTPLIVEVMPGGKRFKLFHQFTYHWKGDYGLVKIVVPIGFITDFASIPRFARLIIPKLGRHNKAAVLHDYIYQNYAIKVSAQVAYIFNREQADIMFRDAMRDLGVAKWKYTLMFWAVRLGGWMAWRKR